VRALERDTVSALLSAGWEGFQNDSRTSSSRGDAPVMRCCHHRTGSSSASTAEVKNEAFWAQSLHASWTLDVTPSDHLSWMDRGMERCQSSVVNAEDLTEGQEARSGQHSQLHANPSCAVVRSVPALMERAEVSRVVEGFATHRSSPGQWERGVKDGRSEQTMPPRGMCSLSFGFQIFTSTAFNAA
jgi:hypothetical protein